MNNKAFCTTYAYLFFLAKNLNVDNKTNLFDNMYFFKLPKNKILYIYKTCFFFL